MSICGTKRCFFEEAVPPSASPFSVSKKLRRCSPLRGGVEHDTSSLAGLFPSPVKKLSDRVDGPVELFVNEMRSATSLDDARARAARALETLERSIGERVMAQSVEEFNKENSKLKEQIETLSRDNAILKRAVNIQHDRQKDYDNKNRELQFLKGLVAQSQEQLRTLEVKNYGLAMYLKQAQQGCSIPDSFNPDVF